jgi:hypothetical protein
MQGKDDWARFPGIRPGKLFSVESDKVNLVKKTDNETSKSFILIVADNDRVVNRYRRLCGTVDSAGIYQLEPMVFRDEGAI